MWKLGVVLHSLVSRGLNRTSRGLDHGHRLGQVEREGEQPEGEHDEGEINLLHRWRGRALVDAEIVVAQENQRQRGHGEQRTAQHARGHGRELPALRRQVAVGQKKRRGLDQQVNAAAQADHEHRDLKAAHRCGRSKGEQVAVAGTRRGEAEVLPDRRSRHPTAWRALQIALLDQVRLDHVFDGIGRFADGGGEIVQPDRATAEFFQNCAEQLAIHEVKAEGVDIEHAQRGIRHGEGDVSFRLDFGIIAHPAQQAVGDAGRAARTAGDLQRTTVVDADFEQACRAADDERQLVGAVEFEPLHDAETIAQRIGEHAGAGGGADQGEGGQVEFHRTRRRAFADHDVDLEVFKRGIEDFFHHGREAVNLVDEEHIMRFEIGEQGGEIPRTFEHRPRSLAHADPHLGGDDVGKRGLAQPWRAKQQHVVERLFPRPRRSDEDPQLLPHLALADVFSQPFGPQRTLDGVFLAVDGGR